MPSKGTKRRKRADDAQAAGSGRSDGLDVGGKHAPAAPASRTPGTSAASSPRTYPRNPASRITRLYAWTIDASVIVVLVLALSRITRGALFSSDAAPQDIFVFLAYFVLPTGIWGRTLGKWVAGIVVVDQDGRTPGVAAAIPREVAWKVLSYGLIGLGVFWIAFDRERRGLHDRLAGTWVVYVPDAGAPLLGRLFRRLFAPATGKKGEGQ